MKRVKDSERQTVEQPVIAMSVWARNYTSAGADIIPASESEARFSLEVVKVRTRADEIRHERRRLQLMTAGAALLIVGLTFAGYCTRRVTDRYLAADTCNPRIEDCR